MNEHNTGITSAGDEYGRWDKATYSTTASTGLLSGGFESLQFVEAIFALLAHRRWFFFGGKH
jgi:hypothetical protein